MQAVMDIIRIVGKQQKFQCRTTLITVLVFVIVTESRPFFDSGFYLGNSVIHDREMHQNSPYREESQSTRLKFVTVTNNGRTVVNSIYGPAIDSRTDFHDFMLMPFWDEETVRDTRKIRFAVYRNQRSLKIRKRSRHGMLGLWG